jgi:hypothetical protein
MASGPGDLLVLKTSLPIVVNKISPRHPQTTLKSSFSSRPILFSEKILISSNGILNFDGFVTTIHRHLSVCLHNQLNQGKHKVSDA